MCKYVVFLMGFLSTWNVQPVVPYFPWVDLDHRVTETFISISGVWPRKLSRPGSAARAEPASRRP
jgi:hypothetical protein